MDFTPDQPEELLDPDLFFRINRTHLLSVGSCKKIYSWSNSRLVVEVAGLDEKAVVARERVAKFKAWLDQ